MTKHGIAIGDMHCGHLVGLTHPDYQIKPKFGGVTKRNKWYNISKDLWAEFDRTLKTLPKLDFVLSLGDHIDGKGVRSGGTELLTTDMQEQCDMAVKVFDHIRQYCKPKVKIVAVYGTDYHDRGHLDYLLQTGFADNILDAILYQNAESLITR